METLLRISIAFGLAFLIILLLHWLVNKNKEEGLYKHGNAVDGYNSPTGDFNVSEPAEPEYKFEGDLTYVKWRKKDEGKE